MHLGMYIPCMSTYVQEEIFHLLATCLPSGVFSIFSYDIISFFVENIQARQQAHLSSKVYRQFHK